MSGPVQWFSRYSVWKFAFFFFLLIFFFQNLTWNTNVFLLTHVRFCRTLDYLWYYRKRKKKKQLFTTFSFVFWISWKLKQWDISSSTNILLFHQGLTSVTGILLETIFDGNIYQHKMKVLWTLQICLFQWKQKQKSQM